LGRIYKLLKVLSELERFRGGTVGAIVEGVLANDSARKAIKGSQTSDVRERKV